MSKKAQTRPTIIHVTSYYPPHLGGMEKGTALRAERFVDRGYTVSVYTSDIGYSRKVVSNAKARVHYLLVFRLISRQAACRLDSHIFHKYGLCGFPGTATLSGGGLLI